MKNYTAVTRPKMLIIGIACQTINRQDRAPTDIPGLWKRFAEEKIEEKIPGKVSPDIIALYCDYESDFRGEYTLVIGCEVDSLKEIPEGMVGKEIPGGLYATFHTTGQYPKSLLEEWQNVWEKNLDRTYIADYELYDHKFSISQRVEIFVGIRGK